jgi:hypothetical protein
LIFTIGDKVFMILGVLKKKSPTFWGWSWPDQTLRQVCQPAASQPVSQSISQTVSQPKSASQLTS